MLCHSAGPTIGILKVAGELGKVWIGALIKEVTDHARDHIVVEDISHSDVESTVERTAFTAWVTSRTHGRDVEIKATNVRGTRKASRCSSDGTFEQGARRQQCKSARGVGAIFG